MLLADEFWLLAHDDFTGKPRLSPRAMGLSLAAAVLGELTMYRKIDIRRGYAYVIDHSPPPDSLVHATLDQITAEPRDHTLRTWLAFFSRGSEEEVAQRLWRAGHVRRETSRRLLKQVVTYVPVDPNAAAWPLARLSVTLRQLRPMEHADAFLAGLAAATGLDRPMLDGAPSESYRYLEHVLATQWQPLRELINHTHAAVGDAVLSHRT